MPLFRVTAHLKLDHAAIRKKIDAAMGTAVSVKRAAYKKAYGIYWNAKRTMMKEFDRHPVTLEIESGPTAVNMSDTLGGYGNLFSFIGFEAGSNPVEELRQLLSSVEFRQTQFRNRMWHFRVGIPSKADVEHVTPMPWEGGNSWAIGIEKGISGLSHYMYIRWEGSRSGTGLQLPYDNWEDLQFNTQPYITEILNNFRSRINKEA